MGTHVRLNWSMPVTYTQPEYPALASTSTTYKIPPIYFHLSFFLIIDKMLFGSNFSMHWTMKLFVLLALHGTLGATAARELTDLRCDPGHPGACSLSALT